MEHRTWTTADKSGWGEGPWQDEPDKEQWQDETGYACLLVRNIGGALCGYVGVPEGHPWYGVSAFDVEPEPDLHNGLSYAELCQKGPEGHTICHVPAPGEPEPLWWLGFHSEGSTDLCPALNRINKQVPGLRSIMRKQTYRDVAYVKAQVAKLAQAAAEAQNLMEISG